MLNGADSSEIKPESHCWAEQWEARAVQGSAVEWNLNIVFRISCSHINQWSLHSDRCFMVVLKLFGQLYICSIPVLVLFDQDEGSSVCVQPVWPQADPQAQRCSVTRGVCINDNNVLTRFDTVDITMCSPSSVHHQLDVRLCACVCVCFLELFEFKGSHIKQHSGFVGSELNCKLHYCSEAAKIDTENLFTTFYSCMSLHII